MGAREIFGSTMVSEYGIPLLNILLYCINIFNIVHTLHLNSEMVWDSTLAGNASTEVTLLESIVPHDRRESALRLFHENKYQINGKYILFILLSGIIQSSIMSMFSNLGWLIQLT